MCYLFWNLIGLRIITKFLLMFGNFKKVPLNTYDIIL